MRRQDVNVLLESLARVAVTGHVHAHRLRAFAVDSAMTSPQFVGVVGLSDFVGRNGGRATRLSCRARHGAQVEIAVAAYGCDPDAPPASR